MKKIIIVLILGFILGITAWGYWYWNKNIYSKEILKLEIIGPSEVSLMEEGEYIVKYKNNGNIRLEDPFLTIEFPEYSIVQDLEDSSLRKEIGPEELGDIYPGQEKTFRFKVRLIGKQGEVKTIKAILSYHPKNLKARYESSTTFSTLIKDVPLTFDFDINSKIESGREFSFYLNYFSNLNYPLSNLGIKIYYPSDFEFIKSIPRGLEKNEWEIPVLNKTEGGRIEIRGRLLAETGSQRNFKAELGLWRDNRFAPLKEIVRGVLLSKPNLDIFQLVNRSDNYIANPGDLLHYEIFFRNIDDEPLTDLFLVAIFKSKGFDLSSIKTEKGKISQGDNSIVWDWRDLPELRYLGPGEEGKVEFWINTKDWETSSPSEKNAVLKNDVLIAETKEEFEVKMNSNLIISQKAYYQDEVFGNSGPYPPRVGETTTFTIGWEVKNYYNEVKNTTVRAVLPENVKLTGKIFPESEMSNFTYDSQSREILWRVNNDEVLNPGAGFITPPVSIFFQVALTPDPSQKGKTAEIIGPARIKGEDQWTGLNIESRADSVDTTLPDDKTLSNHNGIVR